MKRSSRLSLQILICCLASTFANCSTGSVIITGKTRPAISPESVEIYLEAPAKYETIGLVEASSDIELSAQAAQDRVVAELKSQAAQVGANGILLITAGSQTGSTTGYISNGVLITSTSKTKTAQAKAIYVIK